MEKHWELASWKGPKMNYPLVKIQKTMEIHHFCMGKSTISMAIFNCYVSSPEGSPTPPFSCCVTTCVAQVKKCLMKCGVEDKVLATGVEAAHSPFNPAKIRLNYGRLQTKNNTSELRCHVLDMWRNWDASEA